MGHELMLTKYFSQSIVALLLYEYFLTLPDEIRYVWGGRKSWSMRLSSNRLKTPYANKKMSVLSVPLQQVHAYSFQDL